MMPLFLRYGIGIAVAFYAVAFFPRAMEKLVVTGRLTHMTAVRATRIAWIAAMVLVVLTCLRFWLDHR